MTEITYQRTKSEVFRFLLRQNLVQPKFWLSPLMLLAFSVFLLVPVHPGLFQVVGTIGVTLAVLIPLVTIRVWSLLATKAAALGTVTLTFDNAGLTIKGSDWKTELVWTSFRKWSTTDEFVLLYDRNNRIPALIPKRAFSPEQLADFLERLQTVGKTPPKTQV